MKDTNKDEKLTEEEALKRAKAEGIEFVDYFTVEGDETQYATKEEAEENSNGKPIAQVRTQK